MCCLWLASMRDSGAGLFSPQPANSIKLAARTGIKFLKVITGSSLLVGYLEIEACATGIFIALVNVIPVIEFKCVNTCITEIDGG